MAPTTILDIRVNTVATWAVRCTGVVGGSKYLSRKLEFGNLLLGTQDSSLVPSGGTYGKLLVLAGLGRIVKGSRALSARRPSLRGDKRSRAFVRDGVAASCGAAFNFRRTKEMTFMAV